MTTSLAVNQNPPAALPSNMAAEQMLLGCVLYDNAAYERLNDKLKPGHFFEPFHARLFDAMEGMIKKGQLAEPIVMMERFKKDPGFDELGGLAYLADLIDRAPPAAHAPDFANLIYGLALRREVIRIGGDGAHAAAQDHETDPREIIEGIEAELFSLAESGATAGGPVSFAQALTGAVEMAAEAFSRDGKLAGVSTGLIDLDSRLGGLHPSDLLILAGRPSMGKTALATNIAFHVARSYAYEPAEGGGRKTINGGQVLFFSLEMSAEQLSMRLLAEVSGVSSDRIRKGEIDASEFGRIRDAAMEIQESPLWIDATGGLAIGKLCARARRQKRTTGLDLIVVDYLQLVTTGERVSMGNRVQEVSIITQSLKALAKELGVPVLALSQLSRNVENRDDKRPQLSDLRESGSIEQDADAVMFVYRESYYLGRAEPKAGGPEHLTWADQMSACQGLAEVIVGKQRHGPIGTVRLSFNEDLTKFGNLAREGRYDVRDAGSRRPPPPAGSTASVTRLPYGADE